MTLGIRVPRASKRADPHRYWRVLVTGKQVLYYTALAEVVFSGKPGGPQLAAGGVASASSNYSNDPTYPPRAFDGNPATFWCDNGNAPPQWLAYQFPGKVDVQEVAITYGPAGYTGIPTKLEFQSSDDGVQWKTQWKVDAVGAWAYGATKVFTR